MLPTRFAVQLVSASVDRGDGSDPREEARAILRRLRIPAALRDASAPWHEREEAVVTVPMTDDDHVVALNDADAIEAALTAADLRAAFADAGLTLWLGVGEEEDAVESLPGEEPIIEAMHAAGDEESDADLFSPVALRVASFSHRGPSAARVTAQLQRIEVEYIESGTWSLQRFETDEPTIGLASGAELPVIELTRTADGGWFDVTTRAGVMPFWPDAERGTELVLAPDEITVPETAELVRRLHAEGDGSRDELVELAAMFPLDVEAAHAALVAEALGGIIGAQERQRAFLAAFGVPSDLIEAAFDEATGLPAQRMTPGGWWALVKDVVTDGAGGFTPLTRRDRPFARMIKAVRERPMLGAALSAGELVVGAALARRRGGRRVLGILIVVDAVLDLAILIRRLRLSR
ncbi:hypothetical protein ACWGJP_14905 [Microbacterium sp. NPDC055903]